MIAGISQAEDIQKLTGRRIQTSLGSEMKRGHETINTICFSVCIICIIGATAVSIVGIWGVVGNTDLIWKSLATLGIVFLAGILTVSVNKMFAERISPGSDN